MLLGRVARPLFLVCSTAHRTPSIKRSVRRWNNINGTRLGPWHAYVHYMFTLYVVSCGSSVLCAARESSVGKTHQVHGSVRRAKCIGSIALRSKTRKHFGISPITHGTRSMSVASRLNELFACAHLRLNGEIQGEKKREKYKQRCRWCCCDGDD